MKIKSHIFPFKSNFFKEQDPFHLVILFFIIFFGTAIFFSIPTFYDYNKYKQQIEKTINNEFKIKMYNLEEISFKFIPSPYLLIKKADFKIQDNEKNILSKLENIKVFISIVDLYKNENIKIKKIVVNKANLYLDNLSLQNFIQNLKKNIVNNFIIKKSTLFFKDKNDEIIIISKIKNFDYKIDFVNSKKILSINGNIFDSDYNLKYMIDYNFPNIQNINLKLKNPNLIIENKLTEDLYSDKFFKKGNLNINFMNLKNVVNYEIKNNLINFINKNPKNSNFDLNGLINFDPFHFNLNIDLKKNSLQELENFFYLVYKNKDLKYENLSGQIKINFNSIDNKLIKKGLFKLIFENSKLYSQEEMFYLKDFAIVEIKDYEYLDDINQVLKMKIKINILDTRKFNRFLFNSNKDKIVSKNLFFLYQYNNDVKTSFISKISNKDFVNNSELYKFNNLQQLKYLFSDDKLFKLD